MKSNPIKEKSFAFALRIIKLSQFLQNEENEYILSKQILRSGTSIGALIREAEHAESKADFTHKMSIALKEANETDYWLDLLHQSKLITLEQYESIHPDIQEILKILASSVKTLRS